jgi:hypothetical protein
MARPSHILEYLGQSLMALRKRSAVKHACRPIGTESSVSDTAVGVLVRAMPRFIGGVDCYVCVAI